MILRIDTDKLPKTFEDFRKLPRSSMMSSIEGVLFSAELLNASGVLHKHLYMSREGDTPEMKQVKAKITELATSAAFKIWIKDFELALIHLAEASGNVQHKHRKECDCGECK